MPLTLAVLQAQLGELTGFPVQFGVLAGQLVLMLVLPVLTIAVTVLGQVEFAVFATAYFLAQVPILLAAVLVFRWMRVADGNQIPGADNP